MKSGENRYWDLVALFDWTQPNISRHLGILARAGMVKRRNRGLSSSILLPIRGLFVV
ncbi:MAG: ArsR family transcriptional regulator [bacterium]|nr:ArsR family transcriptional regulator [bacterium]